MNEKALIKKCRNGDKEAFEDLIRLFYPYVFGFLLKTTKEKMLAEDLTQDTFLKMIRNFEKYNTESTAGFGTWLITIAKNCYIDHMRREHIFLEDVEKIPVDSGFDVADYVLKKMRYEEALQAIDQLPPEQGMAIRLKYVENQTLAEIAGQFGVETKTVKSRIHDGTIKLRRMLHVQERKKEHEGK